MSDWEKLYAEYQAGLKVDGPCHVEMQFTCPNCGGNFWGTGGEYGFCHGKQLTPTMSTGACGFWWRRDEDWMVMKVTGVKPGGPLSGRALGAGHFSQQHYCIAMRLGVC